MEPLENNHSEEHSRWEGLKTRIISGVVLAALALLALWIGGWPFTLLVLIATMLMTNEWNNLTGREKPFWRIAGLFYVAIPCASMIWLRNVNFTGDTHAGAKLVLFVLLVVSATDIGAFFAGRKIGGPKLVPHLSPNKTWAGLAGGIVSAAIIAGFSTLLFSPYPPSFIAGMDLGILLAVIAQAGDLFESWLKRRAGTKDSGTLIPGHGGLLDRVDGYIFTTPVFALFVYMSGNVL
jgi:phosphatidate cytidylyltransferase